MTYAAAHHKRVSEIFRLLFWLALMLSIFMEMGTTISLISVNCLLLLYYYKAKENQQINEMATNFLSGFELSDYCPTSLQSFTQGSPRLAD